MKRLIALIVACALLFAGCSKSLNDIKVTGCDLVSVVPMGLHGLDAMVEVTVDNPMISFEITEVEGVLKLSGRKCLTLTTDGLTIDGKCEKTYPIPVKGVLDDNFNPFTLLMFISEGDFSDCSIDIKAKVSLRNGIGKVIEKKDIPVKDLIDRF